MRQHAYTLKTPLSNHGSHANRRTTVSHFFSKNIRQHLNPEVPTKFYRKERPHDLWRRSYHLRLSPTLPMFGQTNIGARLMAYPNEVVTAKLCVQNTTAKRVCWDPMASYHDDVIKWKQFPRYWAFVREFTGHQWIPHTKASDTELWCFLWSAPE